MKEGSRGGFASLLNRLRAPEELTPEQTVLRAEAMLEEAARAADPAEKERIRRRFWKSLRRRGESPAETKRRVFLAWPPAEGALRNAQLNNLELLRQLKSICDRNGLTFFLLWGTLLGSVRHRGYIPWDDDIDVGMTASDYERLRALLADDPHLRVDMYYNWDYGTVCPKLKYKSTESFWVDLFLFEEIRVSEENRNDRWMQVKTLGGELQKERLKIIQKYYPPDSPCLVPVRDERIDREIGAIRSRRTDPLDFYGGEGNALMESIDINPVFIRNLFMKERVYPLRKAELPFENDLYDGLRNTEEYLTAMYGNYMDLPDTLGARHAAETK